MKKKDPFDFQSKVEIVPINELIPEEDNPRFIKRKKFDELKQSIKTNPNGMMLRPVLFDRSKKGKITAGNQRHRACLELGWERIPAIDVSKLTKKEKEHIMIWDNVPAGEWDYESLATWDNLFGFQLPEKNDKHKYNDENAEMPIVPKFDEKYFAVLIVVENEMDFTHLCTRLGLGKAKDYKSPKVKQTQVISFKDFIKKLQENETGNTIA